MAIPMTAMMNNSPQFEAETVSGLKKKNKKKQKKPACQRPACPSPRLGSLRRRPKLSGGNPPAKTDASDVADLAHLADLADLAEVGGALGAAFPSVDLFGGVLVSFPRSRLQSGTFRSRRLGDAGLALQPLIMRFGI